MNHEYRKLAMGKELSSEDEQILWEHGSKLAFQYSNSGFKQKNIVNGHIKQWMNICLILASLSFCVDLYFNTFAKNRQLNLESVSVGVTKYELIPNSLKQKNSLVSSKTSETTLSLEQYITHIQKPNFKCGELDSLTNGFGSEDGYPLCKSNSLEDIYIVGNINQGEASFPILSIIHEGQIYNLDLDTEMGISTLKIEGADTLRLDRVMNSFAATFPEYVREFKPNALIRTREQK